MSGASGSAGRRRQASPSSDTQTAASTDAVAAAPPPAGGAKPTATWRPPRDATLRIADPEPNGLVVAAGCQRSPSVDVQGIGSSNRCMRLLVSIPPTDELSVRQGPLSAASWSPVATTEATQVGPPGTGTNRIPSLEPARPSGPKAMVPRGPATSPANENAPRPSSLPAATQSDPVQWNRARRPPSVRTRSSPRAAPGHRAVPRIGAACHASDADLQIRFSPSSSTGPCGVQSGMGFGDPAGSQTVQEICPNSDGVTTGTPRSAAFCGVSSPGGRSVVAVVAGVGDGATVATGVGDGAITAARSGRRPPTIRPPTTRARSRPVRSSSQARRGMATGPQRAAPSGGGDAPGPPGGPRRRRPPSPGTSSTRRRKAPARPRSKASISAIAELLPEMVDGGATGGPARPRGTCPRGQRSRSARGPRRSAGRAGGGPPASAWRRTARRSRLSISATGSSSGSSGSPTRISATAQAVPAAHELAGLVGRHRVEPGAQPLGVAQRAQLAPGDRPGRLGGVLGDLLVPGHDVGHPDQVAVVRVDDPREGHLVAGDRLLDGGSHPGTGGRRGCEARHIREMPLGRRAIRGRRRGSVSRAARRPAYGPRRTHPPTADARCLPRPWPVASGPWVSLGARSRCSRMSGVG